MAFSVVLEDEHHTVCHLLLFTDVTNAAEVRKLILSGQVEASLIKPQMVGAKWLNISYQPYRQNIKIIIVFISCYC